MSIICVNDFSDDTFEDICKVLDSGGHVKVISILKGNTRNNMVQNVYKDSLEKLYGDRLFTQATGPYNCFDYEYDLLY